jgi:hypothetical protein
VLENVRDAGVVGRIGFEAYREGIVLIILLDVEILGSRSVMIPKVSSKVPLFVEPLAQKRESMALVEGCSRSSGCSGGEQTASLVLLQRLEPRPQHCAIFVLQRSAISAMIELKAKTAEIQDRIPSGETHKERQYQ